MGANSHIQWCDATFNPWEGCTKVSEGCKFCYAETRDKRFTGGIHWGKGAPRRRTSAGNWKEPIRWDEAAKWDDASRDLAGMNEHRPRVFCASLADWLDNEVPIEWLAELLALVLKCDNLDWLLLTKRPELWATRIEAAQNWHFDRGDRNVAGWLSDWRRHGIVRTNIWLGTSVEDQKWADIRCPLLLQIPAKVRFLSMEPLLGPVELPPQWLAPAHEGHEPFGINWVIIGGESGSHRKFSVDACRAIMGQCRAAGVPVFVKQLGRQPFTMTEPAGVHSWKNQNMDVPPVFEWNWNLKDRGHGGNWDEWPEDLRVRELPPNAVDELHGPKTK